MDYNLPTYDDELRRLPLSDDSDEYNDIRFKFELWAGTSQMRGFSVYKIEDPLVRNNFEQTVKVGDTIEAWSNCANHEECNHPLRIKRQGFTVRPPGFPLCSGKISLSREKQVHRYKYQFVMTLLATRKILCCDKIPRLKKQGVQPSSKVIGALNTDSPASETQEYPYIIPEGYDTLYINNPESQVISKEERINSLDKGVPSLEDQEESPGNKRTRNGQVRQTIGVTHYIVKNANQLLPKYLIEFSYKPQADEELQERRKKRTLCESCGKEPATVYCFQDGVRLCANCDTSLHSHSRLLQAHKRVSVKNVSEDVSISSQIRISESKELCRCPNHPDIVCEYFDPILECPVCVKCKVDPNGTHATGENSTHPLIPLADAYKRAAESCEMVGRRGVAPPPGTRYSQQRIDSLQHRLRNIYIRMREVYKNLGETEDKIVTLFNKAERRLRQVADEKISALYSEEVILKEELMRLRLAPTFMKDQVDLLDPVQFIGLFKRYSAMQNQLQYAAAKKDTDPLPTEADVCVNGEIQVCCGLDYGDYNYGAQGDNYGLGLGLGDDGTNPFLDNNYKYDDYQYNDVFGGFGSYGGYGSSSARFRSSLFRRELPRQQTFEEPTSLGGGYGYGGAAGNGLGGGAGGAQQQQILQRPMGYENPSTITSEPEVPLGFSAFGENTVMSTAEAIANNQSKGPSGTTPFDMRRVAGGSGRDGFVSGEEDGQAIDNITGYGDGDMATPYVKPTREIISGVLKKAPLMTNSAATSRSGSRPASASPSRGSTRNVGGTAGARSNFYLGAAAKDTQAQSQSQTPGRGGGTPKPRGGGTGDDESGVPSSRKRVTTKGASTTSQQSAILPTTEMVGGDGVHNGSRVRASSGPMLKKEMDDPIESSSDDFLPKDNVIDFTGTSTTAPATTATAKSPQQIVSSTPTAGSHRPRNITKFIGGNPASMKVLAETVRRELVGSGAKLSFVPFGDSQILTREMAQMVYYCVINNAQKTLLKPRLAWAIHSMGRGMNTMHILVDVSGSSLVVVRSGTRVFGGFAAESWNTKGEPFGMKGGSFLFSIDNDKIIKYRSGIGLMGTQNSLVFGNGDLILSEDFESNFSELGNSYGYEGMTKEESKSLLAGSEQFEVDDAEIYLFDK